MYKSNGTQVVSALRKTQTNRSKKRSIQIAPESRARNLYLNGNEQVANNYVVPTKKNRRVSSMQNDSFVSPGPQSHAIIAAREAENSNWNKSLSYAETYNDPTNEERDDSRTQLGEFMRNYGNAYPNAIVAYDAAYAAYEADHKAADRKHNRRIAAIERKYSSMFEEDIVNAREFSVKQIEQLKSLRLQGRLSKKEHDIRSAIIKDSTDAAIRTFMEKKDDWRKFAIRASTDRYDAAIEATEQEFVKAMSAVKPIPRASTLPFPNRLRNATIKARNERQLRRATVKNMAASKSRL